MVRIMRGINLHKSCDHCPMAFSAGKATSYLSTYLHIVAFKVNLEK